MQKRNDEKGYERGAKGIDKRKGEGFQQQNIDKKAMKKMYGENYRGTDHMDD